ncbi:MAG: Tm-1-like ATP-binding domain-containing protein [Thiolinea sp.]
MNANTILVIGTYDTKNDELEYIATCIRAQGGRVLSMDVSVLGDPARPTDISKHTVAEAGGSSIQAAIDSGDENTAMQIMTRGAVVLARRLHGYGEFDGVLILGGTMGTDLALDVCRALPMGVPKYVVSTVSFSPLIEPGRLASDIQMILWAGGLYGLNSVCKASLSQAAGAVLGAARTVQSPQTDRPVIGMTSLGSSCLSYMKILKPALEARGFEVAIFHSTGMGGMAFESIAAQGGFACVMDFCQQELGNLLAGSVVSSGEQRLLSAGQAGIPQLIAPGALDLIDFAGWQDIPERYQDRPFHTHNRLIKSAVINAAERREAARELARRAAQAKGPVHIILPTQGIEAWDRPGEIARDPQGLAAFNDEMRQAVKPPVQLTELDAHINDQAFADTALAIFDQWCSDRIIKTC